MIQPAYGGADRGREDGDETVEGEGLTALFLLEGVGLDGLGHGLRATTTNTLEDPADEQDRQRGGDAAEEARDGKDHDAEHEEVAATDDGGGPASTGKDDGVRDQIAGQDPGPLIVLAPRLPAMWGRATLAIEVSRTSIKAARATVAAISTGLPPASNCRGLALRVFRLRLFQAILIPIRTNFFLL